MVLFRSFVVEVLIRFTEPKSLIEVTI